MKTNSVKYTRIKNGHFFKWIFIRHVRLVKTSSFYETEVSAARISLFYCYTESISA